MDNGNDRELEILAHNITWLREHYGISKKEMAKQLGIGITTLNQIEKGRIPARLGVNVILKVYEKFGVLPSEQTTVWLE